MVQHSLLDATKTLNVSIERMTTGYRINSVQDDAAGYAVASNMSSQLSSYSVAKDNSQIGSSYINTATSSLDIVTTQLQRIRDLTEEASNGTYGTDSRQAMQEEIDQRSAEINRIMSSTEYSGKTIFKDSDFITPVTQLSEADAITAGYTTIHNASELQNINSNLGGKYILMGDIDLSSISNFSSIGNSSTKFTGELNGNGHAISNLTINSTSNYTGLFGYTNGKIQNLGLTNVNIQSSGFMVGGLVGYNDSGIIINCYASGNVSGYFDVGGLVGYSHTDTIANSYATGNVSGTTEVGGLLGQSFMGTINNSYASENVSGTTDVGGLVGENHSGIINNSYASENISGTTEVGGLVGYNYGGTITNSYATGNASGITSVGGLVGMYNSGAITNSIYNSANSTGVGGGSSSGVIGLTLGNIENKSVMAGYGFTSANGWSYEAGDTPLLTTLKAPTNLQVGINSSSNSTISVDTGLHFSLPVDVSTSNNARNSLNAIDKVLSKVTQKQTALGADSNRLDSVGDSIDVSIDNLTSSLSTIKDTDVASESSTYISKKILQQASATLLTTANQSASIALQLI